MHGSNQLQLTLSMSMHRLWCPTFGIKRRMPCSRRRFLTLNIWWMVSQHAMMSCAWQSGVDMQQKKLAHDSLSRGFKSRRRSAQKPFILSYEQLSDVLALVFCTSTCCHISQKVCTGVTRCKAVNDELGCAAYSVCSNCQCQPLHMSCQVLIWTCLALLNLHPACHPCL